MEVLSSPHVYRINWIEPGGESLSMKVLHEQREARIH